MKGVYTEYEIRGYNLDVFLNYVKKKGISVYDVKKIRQNSMNISVKYRQSKKFFAISKEMCYNIKKIKDKGRLYPFLYLFKNVGLVIGAILFLLLAIISNDYIFKIEYTGTGNVLKHDIRKELKNCGVTEFSRFSSLELDDLSKKILSSTPGLTFVECTKDGNVLTVNSVLSEGNKDKLTGTATELVSTVDGVLEDLKIYRGSARVKVGDEIKKGQILVDGLVTVKEQELKVNVLAVAYIRCKKIYFYESKNQGLETAVLTLYEEIFDDDEIIESNVVVSETLDGYVYEIEIQYRRIITVG